MVNFKKTERAGKDIKKDTKKPHNKPFNRVDGKQTTGNKKKAENGFKSQNKAPLRVPKTKKSKITEDPIEMSHDTIRFGKVGYPSVRIKIYDYSKNQDVVVGVTSKSLHTALMNVFFADNAPQPQIDKADEIFAAHGVYLEDEWFKRMHGKREWKEKVEFALRNND